MRVVITGGPCSGKTSLVNHFQEEGFQTVPEAAITVIKRLINIYGKEGFLVWKKYNFLTFQKMILSQQLSSENQLEPGKLTILDRGTIDSIAYLNHKEMQAPESVLTDALSKDYDLVILCETLKNFDSREASGRTETYDESIRLHQSIKATYQSYGYEPLHLASNTLSERAKLIHQHINDMFERLPGQRAHSV